MKALLKVVVICRFLLLSQRVVLAQIVSSTGQLSVGVAGSIGQMSMVRPEPYSAVQEIKHTQTLSDGTHIVMETENRMYRESQGRTRNERSMPTPVGVPKQTTIDILDPVAYTQIFLDPQEHVAHRTIIGIPQTLPPVASSREARIGHAATGARIIAQRVGAFATPLYGNRISSTGPSEDAMRPQTVVESLGTQMIEGVLAQGQRITTTVPVGSQGNDRPLISTQEHWYSPDLQMEVLPKISDPRNGESVTSLTNISRSEPDLSLFEVPSDYTIQEQETHPDKGLGN